MKNKANKIAEAAVNAASNPKMDIELKCIDDLKMTPISWLWKHYIAKGKVTIVCGDPGLGKSQVMSNLAATVTVGREWPDSSDFIAKGSVVLLSAEDDAADTIKPRLLAAGADPKKCHVIEAVKTFNADGREGERSFDLSRDIERLSSALKAIGDVRLIIIDPISAYMGATDSHNNAEVRALIAPLAIMATKLDVAVILVSHLNKSKDQNPLARIIGSIALIAAARAGYMILKDESNDNIRYFIPIKNNIGNDKDGFAFHIEGVDLGNDIETSRVVWSHGCVKAQKILNPEKKTSTNGAQAFLSDFLSEEPKSASEVLEAAEGAGYSKASIQRAANRLGVVREKMGMSGGWIWELKSQEDREGTEGFNFS